MSSSDDLELKKEAAPARKGGVKHWLVGDYDWGYLCKPQVGAGCDVLWQLLCSTCISLPSALS
jgi:hypothetical protein